MKITEVPKRQHRTFEENYLVAHRNKPQAIWKNMLWWWWALLSGKLPAFGQDTKNAKEKHVWNHINPYVNLDLGNPINKTMNCRSWPFNWLSYFGLGRLLLGYLSQGPGAHICFLLFGPFRKQNLHWPGAGRSPAAGQTSLPAAGLLLQAVKNSILTAGQAMFCLVNLREKWG